jgi:predicted enzyme related to lactoylglutathione lyase
MPAILTGITQIAIPAKDIERATAFYRDTLGMTYLFNAPKMAFLDCAGIRIYLDANPGGEESGGNSLIYFKTVDIEHAHAELKEKGAAIHQAPDIIAKLPDRDVWLMWMRDSEGNLLGIMEERKK